ncbi:MAG: crotonase/enoyl-CoA hydratase family protein, partial [Rhodobiaceae bacterium]|nr:crotonase/enoyl-CoA hydratase family protein [Rhodobiaceae bacterium]
ENLKYELKEDVAYLTINDGKANALSFEMIEALTAAFDKAADEATTVVLRGEGRALSAGFDLSVMGQGVEAAQKLVLAGAHLMLKIYEHPQPVIMASPGHALAAGGILLFCGDHRIGTQGAFRIGLNETAIGMVLPEFAIELARVCLETRYHTAAIVGATLYDPTKAVDVGYLDVACASEEVDAAIDAQIAHYKTLNLKAYAGTKHKLRNAVATKIRDGFPADLGA